MHENHRLRGTVRPAQMVLRADWGAGVAPVVVSRSGDHWGGPMTLEAAGHAGVPLDVPAGYDVVPYVSSRIEQRHVSAYWWPDDRMVHVRGWSHDPYATDEVDFFLLVLLVPEAS